MNRSKFLLIDSAIVITAIPLLFLLQGREKTSLLIRRTDGKEHLRKNSLNLPKKEKLIEMEKLAQKKGSGIEFDSLIGDWKFLSVWKKDIDEEDTFLSSLLRLFSAKIEFKNKISTTNSPEFIVVASIQFGLLTIEFSGSGNLKGKQPLLQFTFNLIELKSGSTIFLSKYLKEPENNKKSFFALIELEKNREWLSARGQGGSIITWLRD